MLEVQNQNDFMQITYHFKDKDLLNFDAQLMYSFLIDAQFCDKKFHSTV